MFKTHNMVDFDICIHLRNHHQNHINEHARYHQKCPCDRSHKAVCSSPLEQLSQGIITLRGLLVWNLSFPQDCKLPEGWKVCVFAHHWLLQCLRHNSCSISVSWMREWGHECSYLPIYTVFQPTHLHSALEKHRLIISTSAFPLPHSLSEMSQPNSFILALPGSENTCPLNGWTNSSPTCQAQALPDWPFSLSLSIKFMCYCVILEIIFS